MSRKYIKKIAGYTIIETMIAVSLFIVIVMAGTNALLNANLVRQKSQDLRSIMDGLSFTMEDMSRSLRTGYNFHCIDSVNDSLIQTDNYSCENGGGISFRTSDGSQRVYYVGTNGGSNTGIFRSVNGGVPGSFIQLNPDEVSIDTVSGFSVLGAETTANGNKQQPLITIRLVGKIIFKSSDFETPFSLQTSVSQRILDL